MHVVDVSPEMFSLQSSKARLSYKLDKTILNPEDLRETLARSIEEGLDTLGGNVGRVILYHVKKEYSLTVEDVIDKPTVFLEALQDMFGAGAFTLEDTIVKTILSNMPEMRDLVRTRRLGRLLTGLRQKNGLRLAVE